MKSETSGEKLINSLMTKYYLNGQPFTEAMSLRNYRQNVVVYFYTRSIQGQVASR